VPRRLSGLLHSLHRLESLKINIGDTGQKGVAVVELTTDEGLD